MLKLYSKIKVNIKCILSRFIVLVSVVFSLLSGLQVFWGWDTIGVSENKHKLYILFALLVICFIIAIISGLFFSNKKIIYSKDDVSIIAEYGDLMKIAFPKKKKDERIVVIAVNRCFDTDVNDIIIDEKSVHGQFIKKYTGDSSDKKNKLEEDTEKSLKESGYSFDQLTDSEKKYGKKKRYPLGSVASIKGENGVTFFLLALTEFDVNCKAHCDKHQYVECILKLFEFYDIHGQGKDLYLYPMGTKMARTGFSRAESLEAISLLTKVSKEHLKSKTSIIVDKKCKNEISLMNL